MAKQKRAPCLPAADPPAGALDTRPDSSPYSAPGVTLSFNGGMRCNIPSDIIKKYSKLGSLYTPFKMSISLENVSKDVGHVLVHHLFTGTYQSLKPQGESRHERLVNEFSISIQVYAFARAYELQALGELAKSQVDELGAELPVAVVLNLVQDAYPNPHVDDIWVSGYVKARLKFLFENQAEPLQHRHPCNNERKTVPIREIVLDGLLQLLRESQVIHQTDLSHRRVLAEVSGNMGPGLPGPTLKLPEIGDGRSDERQLINTDRLSCEKDMEGAKAAIPGLDTSRKLNAKERRQARRELKVGNAEALAELDLEANKPEPRTEDTGEVNGSNCKFGLEEDTEKIIEEEWIYTGLAAGSAE